ncbi:MAG TPA: hypothetical protein VKE51_03285 [Vicinamibacterales bacterium]|nr:hypothetical protein [Vicinamibacterales bacterium]
MTGAEPSANRGVMIVLAYLWLLALVPLLAEKQDPDVQWHAKHGLVLMAAELIVIFGYAAMTSIVSFATLGLGCVLGMFLVFAWVGILALHVVAILKGINGGRLIIPGISEYANRF